MPPALTTTDSAALGDCREGALELFDEVVGEPGPRIARAAAAAESPS